MVVAVSLGSLLAGACSEPSDPPAGLIPATGELPQGHPDISQAPAQASAPDGPVGVVLETMDSGGYTYALVDISGEAMWAAGPVTSLAVGDTVVLAGAMGMRDFTSSTLDRSFDEILFVGSFAAAGSGSETFAGNTGLVRETADAAGYTYVLVEIEGESLWLAGPQTAVSVGQTVGWMGGDLMRDFSSTSMNRTFDAILFVNGLRVVN
jgi:hypothetical protein